VLTIDDQLSIHRLISLYGHVIDERQFSRIGEIFTQDAEYDVRKRGSGIHRGIPAIRRLWEESKRHPLAHHATNVVIDEQADGTVEVHSKAVCVHGDGTVHSTTYRQSVVRTGDGWRISRLAAEMRTSESVPPVS
jgi:hypothetical protein